MYLFFFNFVMYKRFSMSHSLVFLKTFAMAGEKANIEHKVEWQQSQALSRIHAYDIYAHRNGNRIQLMSMSFEKSLRN